MNEGWANKLVVQAEATLAGSPTGSAYGADGRLAFSYEPVLEGRRPKINVWRRPDGDSFAGRWYRLSIDTEYSHGEATALLLSSILKRAGTSPNYTFRPNHTSAKQSLAIGLSYVPNNLEFVFRGCVVEQVQLAVRAREIVRIRWSLSAAKMTTDGPLATVADANFVRSTGLGGSASYESVSLSRSYEWALDVAHRIEFGNFGEDAVPADYQPASSLVVSGDLAEWMGESSADGDRIAADARNQSQASALLSVVPAPGKLFEVDLPRILVRAGTPPGIQQGGIGYRASFESQSSEGRTDEPLISMLL
jgi:hypothetical protein